MRDLLELGREGFERRCRAQTQCCYIGDREALCRVLGKYLMYVDSEDTSLAPHMMMNGYWESWVTLALRRLRPDMKCIDVGANHGYFTLLLADLCKDVVAFEPQQHLASKIARSLALNGFAKTSSIVNAAVGAESGFVKVLGVEGEPFNTGSRKVSMEQPHGDERARLLGPDQARCVVLDEEVEWADFIKIDAESFEDKIWEGMQGLIEKCNPIILMEFTPEGYDDPANFLREIRTRYRYIRTIAAHGDIATQDLRDSEILHSEFTMLWLEN